MGIHVVGGVYREHCVHPGWNEIYGSAGRAALAIATMQTPAVLHSYMDQEAQEVLASKGVLLDSFELRATTVTGGVRFRYLHDLATPVISGTTATPFGRLEVHEEKVVRFGMLDGDAHVDAEWAVYDPQNVSEGRPFRDNGSKAKHLALVLNSWEAANMAGRPGAPVAEVAPLLAAQQRAEVIIVKMGPLGAYVWTASSVVQVPAYRTKRVWKIGSGDCFVAHFANAWMEQGRTPAEAAQIASKATAYYCDTQGFVTPEMLADLTYPTVQTSAAYCNGEQRQIYLAGPFFDLSQVWMVEQARADLAAMGLKVFSPYHDIGLGTADVVVEKDLDAIKSSHLLFALADGLDAGTMYEIGYARALGKPVVVYSDRHHGGESLKMMDGSGCLICNSYATGIYSALWEAVKI